MSTISSSTFSPNVQATEPSKKLGWCSRFWGAVKRVVNCEQLPKTLVAVAGIVTAVAVCTAIAVGTGGLGLIALGVAAGGSMLVIGGLSWLNAIRRYQRPEDGEGAPVVNAANSRRGSMRNQDAEVSERTPLLAKE